MSTLLITGGAGYVGSAMARRFLAEGHAVAVVDDLSTGHAASLPPEVPLYRGDFADEALLGRVLGEHPIAGVIHCAARSLVEESTRLPELYMRENFEKPKELAGWMASHGVKRLLFSSSAAVYGEPARVPIVEEEALAPTHPYGRSKAALEGFLDGEHREGRLVRVSLRYFNAAGAGADGAHGEAHRTETHLIPRLLAALRDGLPFEIFGTDYATADGTALRDFVHIDDLARAHLAAWRLLEEGKGGVFNLGSGRGYTVLEVCRLAERVSGRRLELRTGSRRAGDPEKLVASFGKAQRELGWTSRASMETILETAWHWHRDHPDGYGS